MIVDTISSSSDGSLPKGVIVMWSGQTTAVPQGWALCDGSNGTPNLSGKFILGFGSGYSIGSTGGEATHTLSVSEMPSHNHQIGSAGSHAHNATIGNGNSRHYHNLSSSGSRATTIRSGNEGTSYVSVLTASSSGSSGSTDYADITHSHSVSINSDGAHYHSLGSAGNGNAHNNMPPYYTLAYIMKL